MEIILQKAVPKKERKKEGEEAKVDAAPAAAAPKARSGTSSRSS